MSGSVMDKRTSCGERKMGVRLEQDEDGFPPASVEWLAVTPAEDPDQWIIDNTPLYAKLIAWKDVVACEEDSLGRLIYRRTISYSGNIAVSLLLPSERLSIALPLLEEHSEFFELTTDTGSWLGCAACFTSMEKYRTFYKLLMLRDRNKLISLAELCMPTEIAP